MTGEDVKTLIEQIAAQSGGKSEQLTKASLLYTATLMQIDFEKAMEALRAIMMAGSMPRGPGQIIAAIIRNVNGSPASAAGAPGSNKPEPAGCEKCQFSGVMEVPHHKDFDENGFWRGEHVMAVSCDCPKGLEKNTGIGIRTYDAMRPNWRDEYPLRRLEWRQLKLFKQLEGTDANHQERPAIQTKLRNIETQIQRLCDQTQSAA